MNRPTIGVFTIEHTASGKRKKVVVSGHYSAVGALASARQSIACRAPAGSYLKRPLWIEAARQPATLPGSCDLRPARIR